jgi:formiminotetrahydrofolate cyclodeaminase
MGLAAVEGAALNVRVNMAGLKDDGLAARYDNDVMAMVERARALRDAVMAVAGERAGIVV